MPTAPLSSRLYISILGWGCLLAALPWSLRFEGLDALYFTALTIASTLLYFSSLFFLSGPERQRGFIRRSLRLLPVLPFVYLLQPFTTDIFTQLSGLLILMGMIAINLTTIPGLRHYTDYITPQTNDDDLRTWLGQQIAIEAHKARIDSFDVRFVLTNGGDTVTLEHATKTLTEDQEKIVAVVKNRFINKLHGYDWPTEWWDTHVGGDINDAMAYDIALAKDKTLGLVKTPVLSAHEIMELYAYA